jgi:DNA-binding SARP family transcriptional activator/Flp pilus assembly protein TadD
VTAMEFGLLGPLVVRRDGIAVPVRRGNQRALLAALLLDANQVVSTDQIAETLWGPNPPPSAQVTIRNYVKRLRQAFGDTGRDRIRAEPNGYLISAGADELDLARFEHLLGSARAAARDGSWSAAAAAAGSALALWRGTPLADVESEALTSREGPRLAELRLQARQTRIEADLHLGRHADVIPELQRLVGTHPLREQLHALLMLALYRCGRQGEALTAYHEARRVLTEELGVEPGPALRELQQRILAADPALSAAEPSAPAAQAPRPARPAPVIPRQLPRGSAQFVGRAGELAALAAALDQAGTGTPGTVVISAIGGTAGVGKTALALHWAHQVADRFPDGQLHVNLRGFDPAGNPTPTAVAMRALLEALEVPAERIPESLDAQAGLYRSLMAGKRMLLVLDNARDAEQVRPLLPGSPGCLVLVTSRSQLAGLAALEGAHSLRLGLLTDAEAHALLAARLGPARLDAEPGATAELIRLCAHLPLALVIVSAQAVARADYALAVQAAELRDSAGRLDVLDAGDPAASVRSVFSWSYRQLSPAAARLFRLLGLHPGPDISAGAAASLAGCERGEARRLLASLTGAHLLTEHAPGRFSCRDLLRFYAAGLAAAHDDPAQRRAATGRLLDYYLHTGYAADRLLRPSRNPITLTAARPGVVAERLAGPEQATAWFDAEHQSVLAAIRYAAESGFTRHAWQLPWSVATYLNVRGRWDDLTATQHTALTAATALGDHAAQAVAQNALGFACLLRGLHDQAASHFGQALDLFQQQGDQASEAGTYLNLSFLLARQGRHAEAADYDKRALHLFEAAGDRAGQARALNAAGWNLAQDGDHHRALARCEQALTLQRQLGDRLDEATTWDSLGYIHHQLGQHADATHCYQQALHLLARTKERPRTAITLDHLGDTHHAAGQPHQARTAWQQALEILSDLNNPDVALIRAKLQQLSPNGAGPAPASTPAKP